MPDIQFNDGGKYLLPSKFDETVCLLKSTWQQHILPKPERNYLRFNTHKIPTTLIDPDAVRESSAMGPAAHLYYKEYRSWKLSETVESPVSEKFKFFVVIVNTRRKIITTIYETGKIKTGKMIWPEGLK